MALQVSVQVPGMVRVTYPLVGQVLSSHARLAGSMFAPAPEKLPAGTQYIIDQLTDPVDIAQVQPSHALQGKQYLLGVVTYYMDGSAVREVDYTIDEVPSYAFGQDYIPNIIAGEELSPGDHRFTIVARFYSLQNPGVEIYDIANIDFAYDASAVSVRPYLDRLTPQQIVGEIDVQVVNAMFDYVLTQRTEGALKNDIDFLANLYDIDLVPDSLVPYLAKTVGYDYFAGLLGSGGALREELRFLPDWQKSAGTAESMLVLLRPLNLRGSIQPLYLDLVNNFLRTGIKQRYSYTDSVKVLSQTKSARFTLPLTHGTFVPSSANVTITAGGMTVFTALWDVAQGKMVCTFFHDDTGSPHVQWLVKGDGSDADISTLDRIFADRDRGGITLVFTELVKAATDLRVSVSYQFEIDTRPGRNTRLSEFFDMTITSDGKPNIFNAVDYLHVYDIVKRSKPLRTKLRQITFPAKWADAYVINPMSASTAGLMSNPDRAAAQNISGQSLGMPIGEALTLTQFNRVIDGFSFTWENGCDRWENRFGMFASLAMDPSLLGQEDIDLIRNDTLLQRGYAGVVKDDVTIGDDAVSRRRWLRNLGLYLPNPKASARGKVISNYTAHYQTIRWDTPQSPSPQTYTDMVMDLDDPSAFSPSNSLEFNVDVLTSTTTRHGFKAVWDGGSGLQRVDLNTGATTSPGWTTNTASKKVKTFTEAWGSATLTVIKFPTQGDVDAFKLARPNLDNYPFVVGSRWYGVWDITADFNATPIHTSVHFPFLYANFQSADCLPVVDTLTSSHTSSTINVALGYAYQNDGVAVEIRNKETQELTARYRWNGSYWITDLANGSFTVTLSPATGGGGWTDTIAVAGTVSYTGSTSAMYDQEITVRYVKVGDAMIVTTTERMSDDFGGFQRHDGTYDIMGTGQNLYGIAVQDLFDLKHDEGNVRTVADEYYFKSNYVYPAIRLSIILPTPNAQMVYDSGDTYDQIKFYDSGPVQHQYVQYLHFPRRIVVNTTDTYDTSFLPV